MHAQKTKRNSQTITKQMQGIIESMYLATGKIVNAHASTKLQYKDTVDTRHTTAVSYVRTKGKNSRR